MNYYQHHIGDFNNATRHLTRVERSLYRDLIELYYDTEQPLSGDIKSLARKVIARSDEEFNALKAVLEEFFFEHEGKYHHDRCDDEIIKYKENSSAKARAGRASAEARRLKREQKKEDNPTGVEQVLNRPSTEAQQNPTNREPLTVNQEPRTSNQVNTTSPSAPEWIDSYVDLFWGAYPKKVDKKKTIERLVKMIKRNPDKHHFAMILKKVEAKALVDDKQFWPSPDRYLREEKWEDEIVDHGGKGKVSSPADQAAFDKWINGNEEEYSQGETLDHESL